MNRLVNFKALFSLLIIILAFVLPFNIGQVSNTIHADAFSLADADTAMNSFNNAFYTVVNGNGYFKADTTGGQMGFWGEAEVIEVVEDAYDRSGNTVYKNMLPELYNGFIDKWGSDWCATNIYNDDVMWMVLACERMYQITGNTTYRDKAKEQFDKVYARGYDTVLGGGLYWTTDNTCKNTCINCPAMIAATRLYDIYGDSTYLDKAKSLYSWLKSTLFNTSTGAVYDNIDLAGTVTTWTFTYNSGTFIGAASMLYKRTNDSAYLEDAKKAADYLTTSLCTNGIITENSTSGDGAGFKGIMPRYMKMLINDCGQTQYTTWMQQNAQTLWNSRRISDNLTYADWDVPCPTGTLDSFACSTGVAMLQCTPAGSGNRIATEKTEAELYDSKSGLGLQVCAEGGEELAGIQNDFYAVYNDMDFGTGIAGFAARVSVGPEGGGSIEIRLDSTTGTLLGSCPVSSTGSWTTYANVNCSTASITGKHNLYLVFKAGTGKTYVCNLNWFKFFSSKIAASQIEAETADSISGTGMLIEACAEGGQQLGGIKNGYYAQYNYVDFGTGVGGFQARVSVAPGSGGYIEMRLDSTTGTLLGICPVSNTGSWTTYTTVSGSSASTTGLHTLYLVFKTTGSATYVCNLNWFTFTGTKAAKSQIEAESLDSKSGMVIESCAEGGYQLGGVQNNNYASFKNVDFGTGVSGFQARAAVDPSAGGSIEVRLDSATGTLLGTCAVSSTGSWTTYATSSASMTSTTGVHTVYLVFKTGLGKTYVCNLNWFEFT